MYRTMGFECVADMDPRYLWISGEHGNGQSRIARVIYSSCKYAINGAGRQTCCSSGHDMVARGSPLRAHCSQYRSLESSLDARNGIHSVQRRRCHSYINRQGMLFHDMCNRTTWSRTLLFPSLLPHSCQEIKSPATQSPCSWKNKRLALILESRRRLPSHDWQTRSQTSKRDFRIYSI